MTLSKVGIKGNRVVKFRERALMFASPQQHVAERHMAYRLLIVQFERADARQAARWVPGSRRHSGRLRQSQTSQIPRGEISRRRSSARHRRHTNCRCKFAAFNREGIK
jgi:hypothetical protein